MYKVAIVGSGTAGLTAAIEAAQYTKDIVLITKSQLGFSNSIFAQGGISASMAGPDCAKVHYRDTMRCGSFRNIPELVRVMVKESKSVIYWLEALGVKFDRDSKGDYILKPSLGSNYPRLLSCGDKTGSVIVKNLIKKIKSLSIEAKERHWVEDIVRKTGGFEIYCNKKEMIRIESKKVILATGGNCFDIASRRKILTTNCKDATGEVSAVAMRLGAKRKNYYSYQYHPLGWLFPEHLRGRPIPETILSQGAIIVGRNGQIRFDSRDNRKRLVRRMMLLTRRGESFRSSAGPAFRLYLKPVTDKKGIGFIKDKFPTFFNMCQRQKKDISREPIFIFPALHYQNGGILINKKAETGIKGLYAAGEVTGGVHGTGRLMGNSLLDAVCFGRIAGRSAAYVKKG